MRRSWARLIGVGVAFGLLGAACTETPSTEQSSPAVATSDTAAAALRSDLNRLLQEHVYLAASAANAALSGRTEEFDAAAAALDGNSDDIIATFGSVYPDAEGTFRDAWKGHIGFVVDYVTGVATDDTAVADRAVADLQGYWESFGTFLSETIPTLPEPEAVSGLVMEHVLTLKGVIDAQAGGNRTEAFSALREAAAHMHMIGDALAEAIVADNPEAF
jgi:hypothetical protein